MMIMKARGGNPISHRYGFSGGEPCPVGRETMGCGKKGQEGVTTVMKFSLF